MSIIDAYDLEELQDKARRVPILERDLAEARAEAERMRGYRDGLAKIGAELGQENEKLRAASINLMAAIDNMHERGETFTARVSIAAADMRRILEQSTAKE
jgi:hypothetical protein